MKKTVLAVLLFCIPVLIFSQNRIGQYYLEDEDALDSFLDLVDNTIVSIVDESKGIRHFVNVYLEVEFLENYENADIWDLFEYCEIERKNNNLYITRVFFDDYYWEIIKISETYTFSEKSAKSYYDLSSESSTDDFFDFLDDLYGELWDWVDADGVARVGYGVKKLFN